MTKHMHEIGDLLHMLDKLSQVGHIVLDKLSQVGHMG